MKPKIKTEINEPGQTYNEYFLNLVLVQHCSQEKLFFNLFSYRLVKSLYKGYK